MFRHLIVGIGVLFLASPLHASGILIAPREPRSPFQRVDQQIRVNLEDQVATTRVEEVFHNPTDRTIEAVYLFPLPKNATVNRFSLWINGAETKGELLDATQDREIYTSIVRKSQDPALLEYLGTNLLRLRVFPIAPKSDQKIALSFTSVCEQADRLVEYLYFQGEGGDLGHTDKVRLKMRIQSQLGLKNIFSPSHSISMNRKSDQEVEVDYEGKPGDPRRHFTLYYSLGKEDVGLTPLFHRSNSSEKGFFGLMISPRFVPSGEVKRIPQDVVLVLDISGSMRGEKLKQAKKAVEKCLQKLQPEDQFGLLAFATGLTPFEDGLKKVGPDSLSRAGKWLGELESSGGTAIDAALQAALDLQPKAKERPFAVVFFTDGQPTIGEINPDRILKNVQGKNQSKTRIFSFGVGDDVNAMLLDKLAENTRAVSTYIREEENIVARVNGLLDKITNPILTNLKLSVAGGKVELQDYYPIELPDLFHGGQLVVFGRYSGHGPAALKLSGQYQKNQKDFVFECQFPEQTTSAREFVEQVWAGRKVGYLLDQIRQNGEQKELKDEVIALARKYGITTPY
ncbi:MAG: VIT and vWA domain-containing protein, partial [Gemmataceae bacterium]